MTEKPTYEKLKGRAKELPEDTAKLTQAEEALRESKKLFEKTFMSQRDAIFILDTQVPPKIKDHNPAATEVFGYTRQEMLGCTVNFLHVNEATLRQFQSLLYPAIGDHECFHLTEFTMRRKNGSIFPTEHTVVPLRDDKGKRVGWVSLVRDITPLKHLQAQILRAQKMEAIGTLTSGIAHDFNNLLMAIQANIFLVLANIDANHPHYAYLKEIEQQIQSGAALTRQLLGYARKGRYQVKFINFNQLVEESSEAFGRVKKQITIHCKLADDLRAIEADRGQIEQVLFNLYVNAADAMPGGGELIVKTLNVTHKTIQGRVHNPRPGNYVLLTVTDTGAGIEKKTQERIFEPFFSTKERGTGLGLTSVYGIIQRHGGYVAVESEEGQGTTFSVYLPASEKKVEKDGTTAKHAIKGSGTILFVDDEAPVLTGVVRALETLGYRVLGAKGGRKAVEIYKTHKDAIDLVILDMIMPEMGGGEVFDHMKAMNPNVKVLLTSGYSIDSQATEILECGYDDFIQKPFDIRTLSRKVTKLLDKE